MSSTTSSRSARGTCLPRILATVLLLAALSSGCRDGSSAARAPESRPNVVWIVADDMNDEIGAFGDPLARTPNLDRLAGEGTRFTNVFATGGVCAPSRAALITGMYATSIGAHHMRSADRGYQPVPPAQVKTFTEYLRVAGYYTSNASKLDYQFSGVFDGAPITNWDEPNGDWRGRADGQPFFAYFTILTTHESQLFGDTSETETDPMRIRVPPYYPDTPLVRRDFARHYDNVARMDQTVGTILAMLEEDGVAEDTIVFFFPDNGRGFPRDKRWIYDGGIHEPLIVRWPGRLEAGTVDPQLVSYVDFAPTVLALAGVPVPAHMQGRVFLGRNAEAEPPYVFAAADRHDDAADRIRAVRDRRFKYIRNYQPDTPYGQTIVFRNSLATMQEIFRLHDEGLLEPPADWYYRETKPVEELYDTDADPDEIESLAERAEYRRVLERMRAAHERWVESSGDLGAVPEDELAESFWPGGVQPRTPPPVLSPAGGSFAEPIEIAIREPVAGASIAYTFEEGPRPHWLLYSGPIPIRASTRLRVRAVRYGWAESDEVEARYEIRAADAAAH
jgi:arylsulfatase A-like enzyme